MTFTNRIMLVDDSKNLYWGKYVLVKDKLMTTIVMKHLNRCGCVKVWMLRSLAIARQKNMLTKITGQQTTKIILTATRYNASSCFSRIVITLYEHPARVFSSSFVFFWSFIGRRIINLCHKRHFLLTNDSKRRSCWGI